MSFDTEVAVVGGGVIGAAVAFHLAEAGVSTTVFERAEPGSGASGATAGLVRTYFPGDPTNAALAASSFSLYRAFAMRTGTDPELRDVGFMVAFSDEAQVESFRVDAPTQHAAGVDVTLITPAEAAERNPFLAADRILAAAWSPQAVLIEPLAVVRGYIEAACRAGARVVSGTPVVTLDAHRNALGTEDGETSAGAIVCAAGPWAQPVAAMAGVHLPISPRRTELLLTDPLPSLRRVPLTLHAASGLRMRPHGDRLLVGMGRPQQGEPREAWIGRLATQLGRAYPPLAGIGLHPAWSGIWDGSPDGTAFIGRKGSFLYAAGFSGHGFCQAPVVGEIVRDLHLGREPRIDLARFSAERLRGQDKQTVFR